MNETFEDKSGGKRGGEKPGRKDESRMMVRIQLCQLIVASATLFVQMQTLIKP